MTDKKSKSYLTDDGYGTIIMADGKEFDLSKADSVMDAMVKPDWFDYVILGREGLPDGKIMEDAPQWAKDGYEEYLRTREYIDEDGNHVRVYD